MIRNITVSSRDIQAGDTISLMVEAAYPVQIVIKCFITHPPPPKFANCEEAGVHVLDRPKPLIVRTSERTFEMKGELEFDITDADFDRETLRITVKNKNFLGGNQRELLNA